MSGKFLRKYSTFKRKEKGSLPILHETKPLPEKKCQRYRVYLASGWFDDEQIRMMREIFKVLKRYEIFEVFAPFWNGIVLTKNSPRKTWKKVFELDVKEIYRCDLMVTNIEGFEPGTIFETGVAYANSIPIIAYSSAPGRSLNLMLAQSCKGFASSQLQLHFLLEKWIQSTDKLKDLNLWEGEPI